MLTTMTALLKLCIANTTTTIKFLKLEGMEGVIAVDENSQPKKITIDELEAIYKQCVELAWL